MRVIRQDADQTVYAGNQVVYHKPPPASKQGGFVEGLVNKAVFYRLARVGGLAGVKDLTKEQRDYLKQPIEVETLR